MSRIKAAVLFELNKPLEIRTLKRRPLESGQVFVKILYSGVCRSQLMEVRGLRGDDRWLPHLLGHEGSGVVEDVGPDVKKFKKGDEVILSWIKGNGIEAQGAIYDSDDVVINSGKVTTFSNYSVVSENRLVKKPKNLGFDTAILFGCALPTGAGMVINEINVNSSVDINFTLSLSDDASESEELDIKIYISDVNNSWVHNVPLHVYGPKLEMTYYNSNGIELEKEVQTSVDLHMVNSGSVNLSNVNIEILDNANVDFENNDEIVIQSITPLRCINECDGPPTAGIISQYLNVEIISQNIINEVLKSITKNFVSMTSKTKSKLSNIDIKKLYMFAILSVLLIVAVYIICYIISMYLIKIFLKLPKPPSILIHMGALVLLFIAYEMYRVILCIIRKWPESMAPPVWFICLWFG